MWTGDLESSADTSSPNVNLSQRGDEVVVEDLQDPLLCDASGSQGPEEAQIQCPNDGLVEDYEGVGQAKYHFEVTSRCLEGLQPDAENEKEAGMPGHVDAQRRLEVPA